MKKIATKFVLIVTSTFIVGSVIAQTQTDTTLSPDPADSDTTSGSVDTTTTADDESGTTGDGVVDTTSSAPNARVSEDTATSFAIAYNAFSNGFHAAAERELLNNRFAVKTEEEQEG